MIDTCFNNVEDEDSDDNDTNGILMTVMLTPVFNNVEDEDSDDKDTNGILMRVMLRPILITLRMRKVTKMTLIFSRNGRLNYARELGKYIGTDSYLITL